MGPDCAKRAARDNESAGKSTVQLAKTVAAFDYRFHKFHSVNKSIAHTF